VQVASPERLEQRKLFPAFSDRLHRPGAASLVCSSSLQLHGTLGACSALDPQAYGVIDARCMKQEHTMSYVDGFINSKVMADPRLKEQMEMADPPFDGKRMIYGGFTTLFEL
jgi:hypothetical protein